MLRLLPALLGMLTTGRPRLAEGVWYRTGDSPGRHGTGTVHPGPPGQARPVTGDTWPDQPPVSSWPPGSPTGGGRGWGDGGGRPPRRRIRPWVKWSVAAALLALVFRRAIAAVVLMGLSGALHLVGVNIHLPHVTFAWPWQKVSTGSVTNTDLGPWVLQKIEGISRPALGQANFTFVFTHKVNKSIAFWPCWYASTFYAVGHASATVTLNPGPAWWKPGLGHYHLQVLSRPGAGKPGHVAVTMVLPRPQLPQSAHDVVIDNIPSKPLRVEHSWTYPGFGCGVAIRPQFAEDVLYAQAQRIAFYKATQVPQITGPLIRSAEAQAARTITDNFIQPTVNAFGYSLDRLTLRWAASPAGP